MTDLSNTEDVIDSRDVIHRIEELEDELADLEEQCEEANDEADELKALIALRDEAEGSPDWQHGECLIRGTHFRDYAEQFAEETGMFKIAEGYWPVRHIDWQAAADELQQDYFAVDFDGVEYWIRS